MDEEKCSLGSVVGMLILAFLFGGLALAIYPGWDAIAFFFKNNIKLTFEVDVSALIAVVSMFLALFGAIYSARIPINEKKKAAVTVVRIMALNSLTLFGLICASKSKNNATGFTFHSEALQSYLAGFDSVSFDSFPKRQLQALAACKAICKQMVLILSRAEIEDSEEYISGAEKWVSIMKMDLKCQVDILHESFNNVPVEIICYIELSKKINETTEFADKELGRVNRSEG